MLLPLIRNFQTNSCNFCNTYEFLIASAADFFTLFMLQIVTAGNGIAVSWVGFGDKLNITGLFCHFWYKLDMKYPAVNTARQKEIIQNNLNVKHLFCYINQRKILTIKRGKI